jgi:hypothetical protein
VLPAACAGGADASANPTATISTSVAANAGRIYLLISIPVSVVSVLPTLVRQKSVNHQPVRAHQEAGSPAGACDADAVWAAFAGAVVLASSVYVALVEPDSAATVAAARNIVLILTS